MVYAVLSISIFSDMTYICCYGVNPQPTINKHVVDCTSPQLPRGCDSSTSCVGSSLVVVGLRAMQCLLQVLPSIAHG